MVNDGKLSNFFSVFESCSRGHEGKPPLILRLSRKIGGWQLTLHTTMENQSHQNQSQHNHQSFWKKNARAVPGRFVSYDDLSTRSTENF